MNKFSESSLKNGLKIITAEVPGSGVVTIKVVIRAGSRFEKDGERGLAHLFEHMLLKGTKTKPSAYDVSLVTDRAGAAYNASTDVETIRVFIQVAKDSVENMVALLSDIILEPLFDDNILENEKNVVLQEMKQSRDNRAKRMWIETVQLLFGNHPLSNYALGTEEGVKSATAEKLRDYHKKFFVAGNMAIIFSGGITHEESFSMSEKYFSGVLAGESEDNTGDVTIKPGKATIDFPGNQTSLNVCFFGNKLTQIESGILDLVANYLGYKQTSLLSQELRHKRGLVYSIGVYLAEYRDAYVFYVNTTTTNPDEVEKIILDKTLNFKSNFTPELLSEYKIQLKNIIVRALDGESALNNYFANAWALYDKIIYPEKEIEAINEIKYEDVIELVSRVFTENSLFVVRMEDSSLKHTT